MIESDVYKVDKICKRCKKIGFNAIGCKLIWPKKLNDYLKTCDNCCNCDRNNCYNGDSKYAWIDCPYILELIVSNES